VRTPPISTAARVTGGSDGNAAASRT
jgi:hypothetical protein